MPAWVSSLRASPPQDRAVLVRFGGSLFWAGWFRWPGKWFHLLPNGSRQEITDPPLWWDKDAPDQSVEEERLLVFGQETTSARPRRGAQQLGLTLEVSDSGMLSAARSEVHGDSHRPTGRLV